MQRDLRNLISVWPTVKDFIALADGDEAKLASRVKYYRALAGAMVAKCLLTESAEGRLKLMQLAADYERLAQYVENHGRKPGADDGGDTLEPSEG